MPGKILSEEKVVDSDSESGSSSSESSSTTSRKSGKRISSAEPTHTTPDKPNKRAKTVGDSSSDDESLDEIVPETNPKQSNGASTNGSTNLISSNANSAPRVYTAPEGFIETKKASNSEPEFDKIFSKGNLAGKQIWHITLPSDVPISSLKEVDLNKATSGATVVSHKGLDYGLRLGEADSGEANDYQLLVADNGGSTYTTSSTTFQRTLHLQQSSHPSVAYSVPQQPHSANGVVGAARPTVPRVKEVRQQPKGLRTRYWPPGFEDAEPDMSEAQSSVKGRSEAINSKTERDASTASSSDEESDDD